MHQGSHFRSAADIVDPNSCRDFLGGPLMLALQKTSIENQAEILRGLETSCF